MTDWGDTSTAEEPGSLLRLLTLIIGSAEIIAFLLFAHLMLLSGDPTGAAKDDSAALLMAGPVTILTLPAVLLAWIGRAPWTALGLALAALPMAAVTWAWA